MRCRSQVRAQRRGGQGRGAWRTHGRLIDAACILRGQRQCSPPNMPDNGTAIPTALLGTQAQHARVVAFVTRHGGAECACTWALWESFRWGWRCLSGTRVG